MTPERIAAAALVDALDRSTGATPALRILARPKYPMRELSPQVRPDGSISLTLAKWGWNYKFRGKKPAKIPPSADTTAILAALNAALAPGYTISTITDEDKHITIILQEVPA